MNTIYVHILVKAILVLFSKVLGWHFGKSCSLQIKTRNRELSSSTLLWKREVLLSLGKCELIFTRAHTDYRHPIRSFSQHILNLLTNCSTSIARGWRFFVAFLHSFCLSDSLVLDLPLNSQSCFLHKLKIFTHLRWMSIFVWVIDFGCKEFGKKISYVRSLCAHTCLKFLQKIGRSH